MSRIDTALVFIAACGGRAEVVLDVEGAPPPAVVAPPIASMPAAPPSTLAAPCGETPASQAACWGDKPRLTPRGRRVTSVDYALCPDDGSAFVQAVHEAGGDCYRPSEVDPAAPVWCCLLPPG